ncbi:hypothetical protein VC83_01713 [Pseudogymnoascus destructans]|uniref:Uncharacterized protein n=2 Tax=Pseudogymnoascus destructans TaxID=655981 RepID=L8G232_PSED2|nr:uncharacterized protein VC83_01713 [Pseudogymnoascus destructans]ELR06869.1 hypothetical protein GMDG_08160 [Pseudogymnoascus destructans 20631-21]OAF61726.1 hypothetical protein VC83_01713 [Pseudogymnoascus destructans]
MASTLYQPAVGAVRQPFAPLNSSRLQTLTSLKNRQNALPQSLASSTKRKANSYDDDIDAENIDPTLSTKRSKGSESSISKPSAFILTKFHLEYTPASPTTRTTLTPKSPARIHTSSPHPALSTPAGRSPTRKRIGLLNRRKTGSAGFTRVDPPNFSSSSSSSLPFSLATALSSTTPLSRPTLPPLARPSYKPSWEFAIHEDTQEETLTNLMEHSTYTLDISSDEESAKRPRDEGRGKENVPPTEDEGVAPRPQQVSAQGVEGKTCLGRRKREESEIEVDRQVLGEVPIGDLYAEDAAGEVIVQADDLVELGPSPLSAPEFEFSSSAVVERKVAEEEVDVVAAAEELMAEVLAPQSAALLEPIEKAEEGWSVWESGSVGGDE